MSLANQCVFVAFHSYRQQSATKADNLGWVAWRPAIISGKGSAKIFGTHTIFLALAAHFR
jgi:hypothetical protein